MSDDAPHAFAPARFAPGSRGGMVPDQTCDVCGRDPRNSVHAPRGGGDEERVTPPTVVFVVAIEDRRADPAVSVHRTRAGAEARAAERMAAHAREGVEWFQTGGDSWCAAGGDPSVRIEERELLP